MSEHHFVGFSENPKKTLDFVTNHPFELVYQGRKTRHLEFIWQICVLYVYLFYVASRPGPIYEKLVFKLFATGGH